MAAQKITYKSQTITPNKAKIILKNNPKNRSICGNHVTYLAQQMVDNEWLSNGQTIVIDRNGALVDGQHRMMAVVEADMPVELIICRGVEPEVIHTIDTGKSRTLANVFEMEGHSYATSKSAFAYSLYKWKSKVFHHGTGFIGAGRTTPSREQVYSLYIKHEKKAEKWVKYPSNNKDFRDFQASNLALSLFLLERTYKESLVNEFLEKIISGGDYKNSPTMIIPRIIRKRKHEEDLRYRWEDLYFMLYGFQAWMEQKPIENISMVQLKHSLPEYYQSYKV